jgi:hypothetical protein
MLFIFSLSASTPVCACPPNSLKKQVLAQIHFSVHLWCTLPFSRNTMQLTQRASAKLDMSE